MFFVYRMLPVHDSTQSKESEIHLQKEMPLDNPEVFAGIDLSVIVPSSSLDEISLKDYPPSQEASTQQKENLSMKTSACSDGASSSSICDSNFSGKTSSAEVSTTISSEKSKEKSQPSTSSESVKKFTPIADLNYDELSKCVCLAAKELTHICKMVRQSSVFL